MRLPLLLAAAVSLPVFGQARPASASATPSVDPALVRAILWPADDAVLREAQRRVAADPALRDMSRMAMLDLEEILRRGPDTDTFAATPGPVDGRIPVQELTVDVGAGPSVPVLVQLPPGYHPDREWPLIFAMHGGPPGNAEQARRGAERMIRVWTEAAERFEWVLAAPAMVPAVTAGERTPERLPYEVFHPEQAHAVMRALRARYRINSDRIVSTGISLGSNFSIAFAAAHPGWLAAIVPVSTEGDSREHLLRNLARQPVYVLEGTQDRNIRAIDGPRALQDILIRFGYDLVYREFGDRAHEGFQEHYDDVLRWLDGRARAVYPAEVVRVPHAGIMPVDRRVYWIESDTRRGLIHAEVTTPSRIDVTARWTPGLTVYLHDRLVNMDAPIEIRVNGDTAFSGRVRRSAVTALEQTRALADERRVYAAAMHVTVSATAAAVAAGVRLSASMAPTRSEGQLSFWEMYATRALNERFPDVGFEGEEAPLPASASAAPEQVAVRVTRVDPGGPLASSGLKAGDLLVQFGGEPFFRGQGAVQGLHHWLVRELRSDEPKRYEIVLWRGGQRLTVTADLRLGPYAEPRPSPFLERSVGRVRAPTCGTR